MFLINKIMVENSQIINKESKISKQHFVLQNLGLSTNMTFCPLEH